MSSWVIRERATSKIVTELFDKRNVDKLNREKYEAIPIATYLGQLNRSIKAVPLCPKCGGHQTSTDAGNRPCKTCGGTGSAPAKA